MERRGTMKDKNKKIWLWMLTLFIGLFVVGCGTAPDTSNTGIQGPKAHKSDEVTTTSKPISDPITKEDTDEQPEITKPLDMKVHFLDVGQADCIIIESDGHFMIVDAGNNDDGTMVVNYLKKLGVTTLDYVIGTHPHEDHIGGLDHVIRSFDVGTVILPEKTHTTVTFSEVVDAIMDKDMSITVPIVGTEYNIGNGTFTIIAPNKDYKDELNNWSVGIKLTNGNNSFVMCGDGEIEAEYDVCDNGIDISGDVLKVGHHGSDTSTSEAFLKAVSPEFAVISVGVENQYGHPASDTLEKLKDRNIKYFRTDEQGTIVATSNGRNITWSTNPSKALKSGEEGANKDGTTTKTGTAKKMEKVEDGKTEVNKGEVKVHITETGSKYHLAGCNYFKKSDIETTLEEAKSDGLEPCSRCNPPK